MKKIKKIKAWGIVWYGDLQQCGWGHYELYRTKLQATANKKSVSDRVLRVEIILPNKKK